MERRPYLVALFASAPIAQLFGMTLSYDGEQAVFDLPFNPRLDHALGSTHGGAIATMLDNAGWFAAAPFFGSWLATVEFHVRLHEPVARQHLRSRGRLLRRGRRISVATMELHAEDGSLVATGSGSFTVTSSPIDWDALPGVESLA